MPVDTPPPARAAGPIPHQRKLSFLMGAMATGLALVLGGQLVSFFT